MKKIILMSAVLTLAAMSSCSIFKKAPSGTVEVPHSTEEVVTDLEASDGAIWQIAGEWAVMELNGRELKINGDNRPTFTFTASPDENGDVNVIGFNGCNYVNGVYRVTPGKLTARGEFLSSMMACPDAPYETEINQALGKITGYTVESADGASTLRLTDESGRAVMVLRNHTLAFLNGAWKVVRIDNRTVPSSADVRVVIDVESKTIHGNAGCNLLNGGLILNLDVKNGVEFRNLSTTRMMCPDMDTERAFLVALEQVTKADNIDADNATLLDDKGASIISLQRIDPSTLTE